MCSLGLLAASPTLARHSSAQDETDWLGRLIQTLIEPTFVEQEPDGAVAALRPLLPLKPDDPRPGCRSLWSLGLGAPSFVKNVSIGFTDPEGGSCSEAKFGLLQVLLNSPSASDDLIEAARLLNDRYGPPVRHTTGRNHDAHWQISTHIAIELGAADTPGGMDQLLITLAQTR